MEQESRKGNYGGRKSNLFFRILYSVLCNSDSLSVCQALLKIEKKIAYNTGLSGLTLQGVHLFSFLC